MVGCICNTCAASRNSDTRERPCANLNCGRYEKDHTPSKFQADERRIVQMYQCNRNIVVFRDITRKVPQYFYKLLYDYIVAMNKSAYATVCTAVAMMTATILAMSIPVTVYGFPPRINGNGAHAPGIPGLNANGGSGGTGVVGQNGGIGTDGTKGGAGQSGSVCINNVCTP